MLTLDEIEARYIAAADAAHERHRAVIANPDATITQWVKAHAEARAAQAAVEAVRICIRAIKAGA